MAIFQSDTVEINNSQENVFTFLCNMNNWEQLMPQERISNWQSTEKECSFKIKGLAGIGMALADIQTPGEINVIAHGKNPFDFTINIPLKDTGENKCNGHIVFEAKLNPMMKIMLETPLTNFFNMLASKLKEINE